MADPNDPNDMVPSPASESLHPDIISKLIIDGDLSKMSQGQRVAYCLHRCRELGIDPAAHPFAILNLSGKWVLYAKKSCTDMLCRKHNITRDIVKREFAQGFYIVEVRASADGRGDTDIGVVEVGSLKGERFANALMKATTKAKRRAVLSLMGVGLMDESEVESIPGARDVTPVEMGGRGEVEVEVVQSKPKPQQDSSNCDEENKIRKQAGDLLRGKMQEAKAHGYTGGWEAVMARASDMASWPANPHINHYKKALTGLQFRAPEILFPGLFDEAMESQAPPVEPPDGPEDVEGPPDDRTNNEPVDETQEPTAGTWSANSVLETRKQSMMSTARDVLENLQKAGADITLGELLRNAANLTASQEWPEAPTLGLVTRAIKGLDTGEDDDLLGKNLMP